MSSRSTSSSILKKNNEEDFKKINTFFELFIKEIEEKIALCQIVVFIHNYHQKLNCHSTICLSTVVISDFRNKIKRLFHEYIKHDASILLPILSIPSKKSSSSYQLKRFDKYTIGKDITRSMKEFALSLSFEINWVVLVIRKDEIYETVVSPFFPIFEANIYKLISDVEILLKPNRFCTSGITSYLQPEDVKLDSKTIEQMFKTTHCQIIGNDFVEKKDSTNNNDDDELLPTINLNDIIK